MYKIEIKPLSLNSAYRGRRFATETLKKYKTDLSYLLPKIIVPGGKLALTVRFGVSTKNSDGDNLIKCLQDSISEKYQFNDKMIYRWNVEKIDVKKGEEFIEFKIEEYLEKLKQ